MQARTQSPHRIQRQVPTKENVEVSLKFFLSPLNLTSSSFCEAAIACKGDSVVFSQQSVPLMISQVKFYYQGASQGRTREVVKPITIPASEKGAVHVRLASSTLQSIRQVLQMLRSITQKWDDVGFSYYFQNYSFSLLKFSCPSTTNAFF